MNKNKELQVKLLQICKQLHHTNQPFICPQSLLLNTTNRNKLQIIGTDHVLPECATQVKNIIEVTKPKIVAIESHEEDHISWHLITQSFQSLEKNQYQISQNINNSFNRDSLKYRTRQNLTTHGENQTNQKHSNLKRYCENYNNTINGNIEGNNNQIRQQFNQNQIQRQFVENQKINQQDDIEKFKGLQQNIFNEQQCNNNLQKHTNKKTIFENEENDFQHCSDKQSNFENKGNESSICPYPNFFVGGEFEVAAFEGRKIGAQIIFLDWSREELQERIRRSVSWKEQFWYKLEGYMDVVKSSVTFPWNMRYTEYVRDLAKDKLRHQREQDQFRERLPGLARVYLDERDQHFVGQLVELKQDGLVVVGLGHKLGIENLWRKRFGFNSVNPL